MTDLPRRALRDLKSLAGSPLGLAMSALFLAGAVAVGTAGLVALWLGQEVRALALEYAADFKVLFLAPDFIAEVVLGTTLLGLFGAWLAVDRELRRFARR